MTSTATAPTKKPAATTKKAAKAAAPTTRNGMADAQKEALAKGREEGRLLRSYLEALKVELAPKRRGRRRSPEQIRERIAVIEQTIADGTADVLGEVALRQERLMLQSDLQSETPKVRSEDYEEGFVKVAKSYSERKGIAYETWRDIGVPASVLSKAGIRR